MLAPGAAMLSSGPAIAGLLDAWSAGTCPLFCLLPEGRALPDVAAFFGRHRIAAGEKVARGQLTVQVIPFTDQIAYDRLLWSCDWNLVRGEDSQLLADIERYRVSKGTLRFPLDQPMPYDVVERVTRAHLDRLERR